MPNVEVSNRAPQLGRVFSTQGIDPLDEVEWTRRRAEITDASGKTVWHQDGVEAPSGWSQLAVNVVASKYLYGNPEKTRPDGRCEREDSIRDLISRVCGPIADRAEANGTVADASEFRDELAALCVDQAMAFNSPVWFNMGLYHRYGICGPPHNYIWSEEARAAVPCPDSYAHPQGSACFIQSVGDDMRDIMALAASEAMLFKFGSGCLDPDMMIVTDRGVIRLATLGDITGTPWQDCTAMVRTDDGPRSAVKFYCNGAAETLRLCTREGTELVGTPNHKVKVVQPDGTWAWRRLDTLHAGDILPLRIGGMLGQPIAVSLRPSKYTKPASGMPAYPATLPKAMNVELALLLGNFMGNGSLSTSGIRWLVTSEDVDARDAITVSIKSLFDLTPLVSEGEGYWEIALNSVVVKGWWVANRFTKRPITGRHGKGAHEPFIPDAVLASNDPLIYGSFFRGLFEADGGCNKGIPYVSTSYRRFAQQIRALLLALGMPTRTAESIPGAGSKGGGPNWSIKLRNATFNPIFQEHVGFIGRRKDDQIKMPSNSRQAGKNDLIWLSEAELDDLITTLTWAQGKAPVQLARKIYGAAMTRKLARRLYEVNRNPRLAKVLDYVFEEVRSVEPAGIRDTADLTIDDNHTYLAHGFVTHNTGTDLSTLRSSRERVAGGGWASGPVSFMRIYDAGAAVIKSGGKTRRAAKMQTLKCHHPDIVEFIDAKVKEDRKARALIAAGYSDRMTGHPDEAYSSVAFQNCNMSVRCTDKFLRLASGIRPAPGPADRDWQTRAVVTGETKGMPAYNAVQLLDRIAENTHICGDPGIQYEDTIQGWHTCPNSAPINSSNPCSEFMFIDDSACNLASLRLTAFLRHGGTIDDAHLRAAARRTIMAQETLVDAGSYPTPEIAANSHRFRPLGLGFCDLGALLMSLGLPYDSPEGRALAGLLAALIHGEAYLTSADLAAVHGPFEAFAENRAPMLRVIRRHAEAVRALSPCERPELARLKEVALALWDDVVARGEGYGFRNSQVTVIAPTGCVTGDTLLLTSHGLLPISAFGDCHGDRWQNTEFHVAQEAVNPIATRFYVNGVQEIYGIRTKAGHILRATGQHRVRVITDDGTYGWKRMDQISVGDHVAMRLGGHRELLGEADYIMLDRAGGDLLPDRLDEQLAEVIGFYEGNGYVSASGGLHLVINDADADLVPRFASALGINPTEERRDGCFIAHFCSRTWMRWFEVNGFRKDAGNRGEGAASATIPELVLRSRTSVLAAFLRGLFAADGTVTENSGGTPVVELTTVSDDLATRVMVALESLGIRATRSRTDRRESSFGSRPVHRVRLSSVRDCARFASQIGFASRRKHDLLAALLSGGDGIDEGDRIMHRALLDDLYSAAVGLGNSVRQDIAARRYQGAFNTRWARRLIAEYPAKLGDTKVARLIGLGTGVRFIPIVAVGRAGLAPTFDISVPERNTYTAAGFLVHNTIAFMMDADTTGIEPEIALVRYKNLAGGGQLKLVNRTVPLALRTLGYRDENVRAIVAYIDEHETIEGCPLVHESDLPVFDCAFAPRNGHRSIPWRGHVAMLAAVQPFVSGAISKTVNMPADATVEDIRGAYLEGWKLGLKALAVYRDGSKGAQPVSTSRGVPEKAPGVPVAAREVADEELAYRAVVGRLADFLGAVPAPHEIEDALASIIARARQAGAPARHRLPPDREATTHRFEIRSPHGPVEGYVTAGFYPGTRQPGEIFITMSKQGSTVGGLMDVIATLTSLGLQYGVPLEVFVRKFVHTRFEPAGLTANPAIPVARSVADYVFQWLGMEFITGYREQNMPRREHGSDAVATAVRPNGGQLAGAFDLPAADGPRVAVAAQLTGPECPNCRTIMVPAGPCYRCLACGGDSGGCG